MAKRCALNEMQGSTEVRPLIVSHHSSLNSGSLVVDMMLNKFAAFSPLRRSYFMMYQSIIPNCHHCLAVLRDHCDIPDYLVRHILAGGNTRTCNQRLFNFLLTKFEKDRDYTELCDLVKMLMDFVYLRANVDKLREELSSGPYASQGRLLLWPPPLTNAKVVLDGVCVEEKIDNAVAAQAVGCMSQEVPEHVVWNCCSQALASPHYLDHQRRRNKAAVLIVMAEPSKDEIRKKLDLPISSPACITDVDTAEAITDSNNVFREDVTTIITSDIVRSPTIESVLEEFPPLKILYPVLVQSLPQNFTNNVSHLEQYLTATAIFSIVSSSDADQGNQQIVDCLVKQLTHQEDLLELCDRLENIPDAPALSHAIEELRKETIMYIHSGSKETTSLNTPLASLNDLSGMNVAKTNEDVFSAADALQPNTTGSEVLKKYYHRLHQSFPSDHMISLGKLVQLGNVSDEAIEWISLAPTAAIGNQRILDFVLISIKGEESLLEFCDVLEKLIEHPALLKVVENLRNDLIEVLQRAKTNSVNVSSKSSQESSDDRSEEITNPMASSGVDQLLARMLSSAGIVDKTIAPPSANRFLPSPATIEEIAGDEEATPDDKASSGDNKADVDNEKTKGDDDKTVGDDVPLAEPVEDTHNTSVATNNVVMSEECVDDSRRQQLLSSAASLSDAASPGPDHFPVPVTSPGVSPALIPPPSPPPSAIATTGTDTLETSPIVIQDDDAVHGTMEEMLLNQLDLVMEGVPGLPVVKKYYGKLCNCLPPNYKKTIQKLRNLTDLTEEDLSLILDETESQLIDPISVNQRIIMHLLIKCETHTELLNVCSTLEELVNHTGQLDVHEFHRELLDCFKRDKEEEQKRIENEQDINILMGSTDAGEEPPESNNGGEDVVITTAMTTTTATGTAVVVTTAPTEPSVANMTITNSPADHNNAPTISSTIEEMLLNQLDKLMEGVPGLPVVKKYYGKLCDCLPPKYKKTIQKLRNLTDLTEEDVILILDKTEGQPVDPIAVNQRVIMHLLMKCQSYIELLTVCSTLEELVDPIKQVVVHEFHRELTDCFKKDKEEEKKRKENEKDINMVMSHQGSADAGEQLPEYSNEVDDKVTSTTASTTVVVTTTPTKPPITGASATSAGPSAGNGQIDYGDSELVKQLLTQNEEFAVLNSNYPALLQSFPNDYGLTLNSLIDHFTNEQVAVILDCSTPMAANQKMLNILISQLTEKMDIMPLCDNLDKIGDAILSQAVEKLRNDLLMALETPAVVIVPAPTSTSNGDNDKASEPTIVEEEDTSEIVVKKPMPNIPTGNILDTLSLAGEYMSIVQKYYTSLLNCLPDTLAGTLEIMGTQLDDIPDELVDNMRAAPNITEANKLLLDYLISQLHDSKSVFAFSEMLEQFAASISEKMAIIEAFRYDILKGLDSAGESTDQSVSLIRLSSYLSTSTEASDQPSIADPVPKGATAGTDPKSKESEFGFPDIPFAEPDEESVLECSVPPAKPIFKPIEDIPKNMPEAKKAALETFDKFCVIMQNYIDPMVMNELFENHKVFSGEKSPINDLATGLHLRVQMSYMLDNIRKHIGIKNAEVFYDLVCSFQAVPDYKILAIHLEVDFRKRCGVLSDLTAEESLEELEEIMKYAFERSQKGYKYIAAPPLFPLCYIQRPVIMKELANAVLSDQFDPNCTTVCATLHGDEGCGKSTLMNALCHQREIKKHFKDGFLFVHIKAHTDICTKLSQLYHLLTNKELKMKEDTGNTDIVISELRHVTGFYFRYLLVIIEDMWDITDIEPYLSAFSNCRVVVTTQESSLITDIPSSTYIEVSHMERREAFSMLYKGIVDISVQLSKESAKCLEKLVDDVRSWPMYLYLVRGQIMHHVKYQKMQFSDALEMVTRKLSNCGLGIYADDRQRSSRRHAEKPSIECSIQMLDDSERNRLLSVIFYAGVGCPLPKPVVEKIWEISVVNAGKLFTKLEDCGIFLCSDIYTVPCNIELTCVQVHSVMAQYVINKTDSLRVIQLWPLKSLVLPLIHDELQLSFLQYSDNDQSEVDEYLKNTCKRIDHKWLAENVMYLTRGSFYDPHFIIYQLKCLKLRIRGRSDLVPDETVQLITDECIKILQGLPKKVSMFNRRFEGLLFENDHEGLLNLFTKFCTDNVVAKAAEKCVRLFDSVAEYCHNVTLDWIKDAKEQIQLLLSDYHENALLILPQAQLYIELRKKIIEALSSDTRKWKSLSEYVKLELKKDLANVESKCKNKTRYISSKHIHQKLKIFK